ncbi:YbaB/EbfC family DNA-binding protein [Nocardia yunnanensis]|uniref:YbaB/EbfC family DNA-binding protein n=1 Tax=Nocardia yunnanensis TaxID=2382165 RepID=A0A386ZFD2_9NOCA|nr:YbaB/EbfC family nucleoid-associated protein [Nocardia yunnanensis]AYF76582.1 YbaB/EbfC family DNA-binding protein [Nocardia yunnanensis]
MTNEAAKAQLADLVELVQGSFVSVARAQQDRARLTATAQAGGRRVTITVNADGVVIKTEFSDDIDDLSYSEIAAAVTEATQEAATQVQQKSQEILAALQSEQAKIPALSEVFPLMPDINAMMPTPPEVSMAPPDAPERCDPDTDTAPRFENVEQFEHDPSVRGRSNIAAPDW